MVNLRGFTQKIAVAHLKCCFQSGQEAQKWSISQNVCDISNKAWLILTTLETLEGRPSFWHTTTMKELNSGVKTQSDVNHLHMVEVEVYLAGEEEGHPLEHVVTISAHPARLTVPALTACWAMTTGARQSIYNHNASAPPSGETLQDFLFDRENTHVRQFILIVWLLWNTIARMCLFRCDSCRVLVQSDVRAGKNIRWLHFSLITASSDHFYAKTFHNNHTWCKQPLVFYTLQLYLPNTRWQ